MSLKRSWNWFDVDSDPVIFCRNLDTWRVVVWMKLRYVETEAWGSPFRALIFVHCTFFNKSGVSICMQKHSCNKPHTLLSVGDLFTFLKLFMTFFFNPSPTFPCERVNICHLLWTSTNAKCNQESKSFSKLNFPKEKDFEIISTKVPFLRCE